MANKYLEKIASTRWVRYLREVNKQSPELVGRAVQKLLPNVPPKTREITNLGVGGSQVADLVVHPRGGAVVRKTPLLENWNPGTIRNAVDDSLEQRKLWEHIGEVSQGRGQFAHLKGYDQYSNYYQYSPPKKKEPGRAMVDRYKRLRRLGGSIRKSYIKAHGLGASPEELSRIARRGLRVENLTDQQYSHLYHMEPKLTEETQEILRVVKQTYPDLWDLRHLNYVGNKIVDLEPSRALRNKYPANYGVLKYTPEEALRDPEGYSKRFFHGGSDKDISYLKMLSGV